jgi:hypothetical protein
MNKVITIIIGGIFGGAIGGGIAYWYLNAKYSKVMDIETQDYIDEIQNLREQNSKLQKQVINKLEAEKDRIASSEVEGVVIDPDQISMDDIIEEEEEDDDNREVDIDNSDSDIRYISMRDYEDDEDYEKEVIKYYSGDGVITQDDEILDEEEFINVCGKAALNDLQRLTSLSSRSSGGDNELYIRNEEYNTDYQIKRYRLSYEKYINSRN